MVYDFEGASEGELRPWPVIVGCLFELDSYEIPEIIDKSGMNVDWTLTKREEHSHKYRKAAYRPRINKCYEPLSEGDKLRVAFIVCEELVNRDIADKLNSNLERIGWRIADGKLSPQNDTVRELFFPPGSQHDAYVRIKEILRSATRSLRVIDPYLDGTIFTILGEVSEALKVDLLTGKLLPDFAQEAAKFQQQYKSVKVEIRRSMDFHDRFIIIDERKCWHFGCSIKDAGNKAFMMSLIEDQKNAVAVLDALNNAWDIATVLPHKRK